MVGAQASCQRLGRPVRARHMAARDVSGGQNPGSKGPGLGPERACPEPLGSWSPGRDRGRELPAAGVVPGCWLSLGVYFLIRLPPSSLHPHGSVLPGLRAFSFPCEVQSIRQGHGQPSIGLTVLPAWSLQGSADPPGARFLLPPASAWRAGPQSLAAPDMAGGLGQEPHQGYRENRPPS